MGESNQTILEQIITHEKTIGLRVLEEPTAHDMFPLVMAAGSQDQSTRTSARELLNKAFFAQAEIDANAETVIKKNLLEEFEQTFTSQKDRAIALWDLAGFEFTRGCNGGCGDCYFGRKKGISAKYTYDSISAFLTKYGKQIQDNSDSPVIISYTDSDFLDWKDIGGDGTTYGAVDIYRLYRDMGLTRMLQNTTTSVPKGSQREFVDLMKEVVRDKLAKRDSFEVIRLSVWKHNILRVESSIRQIQAELLQEGLVDTDIQRVLSETCLVLQKFKDEHVLNVGFKINKADPYNELSSVHCTDGLVLSPGNVSAVSMIASTMYHPAGVIRYRVADAKNIPVFRMIFDHNKVSSDSFETNTQWMKYVLYRGRVFLPDIVSRESGNLFGIINSDPFTPERLTDASVWMSRTCLSMNMFIESGSKMLKESDASTHDVTTDFFKTAKNQWQKKEKNIQHLVDHVQSWDIEDLSLQIEREYFVTLIDVMRQKVNILFDIFAINDDLLHVEREAYLESVESIGVSHKDRFQEIFEDLRSVVNKNDFISLLGRIYPSVDIENLHTQYQRIRSTYHVSESWLYTYISLYGTEGYEEWAQHNTLILERPEVQTEMQPLVEQFIQANAAMHEYIMSRYGTEYRNDSVYTAIHQQLYNNLKSVYSSGGMIDRDR